MMKYIILLAFLLSLFSLSYSSNTVKIYVPANNGLEEQMLRVNQEAYVYIEFTNDINILTYSIPLEVDGTWYERLWDSIPDSDVTFYELEEFSLNNFKLYQSSDYFPDTMNFYGVGLGGGEILSPGTHLVAKIKVTPTQVGVITWDNINILGNSLYFIREDGTKLAPQFIAEDIVIFEEDCNDNGIADNLDIQSSYSMDCNDNKIPDECDILYYGQQIDCNNNGILDICDPEIDLFADCDDDGVIDACEVDCNLNGIPDDCDEFADCNCSGIPDDEDIVSGLSQDTDLDGVPDECADIDYNNWISVYTPETPYHAKNELIAGYPEEIFIKIKTEFDYTALSLAMEISGDDTDPLF